MILVVGATSRVGKFLLPMLLLKGYAVRAMTHLPQNIQPLNDLGVEAVLGDLRDPASLTAPLQGVDQVVTCAHAFGSTDPANNIHTVDQAGNRNLIDAAKSAGVKHFVFISILGASPDSPLEFFRLKYAAERYLQSSGLSYTILRATAFMEFWGNVMFGGPVLAGSKVNIFGNGENPQNYVSAEDVAQFVMIALEDARARNQSIDVGGPENLTMHQIVATYEKVSGCKAQMSHMPVPMMRVMRTIMGVVNPSLAVQITGGVLMATSKETFDVDAMLQKYPVKLHRLEEVARRMVVEK